MGENMEKQDNRIIMSQFISFLEKVLLLNDMEVETILNIYAHRSIKEGYEHDIYEYCLKSINEKYPSMKLYFLIKDEGLLDDIENADLILNDIIVDYSAVIKELIYNIDREIDSNRRNLVIDYIVMLLNEVELAGAILDDDTYQELFQLCFFMKQKMEDPDLHYYIPVKQKTFIN